MWSGAQRKMWLFDGEVVDHALHGVEGRGIKRIDHEAHCNVFAWFEIERLPDSLTLGEQTDISII